jgi:TonB family protein
MTSVILEAALRSSALMVVVWLLLRALRVRNPSLERTAWVAVLLAAIAMPLAMKVQLLPTNVAPAFTLLSDGSIGSMPVLESTSFDWQAALLWTYLGIAGLLCMRQLIGLLRLWRLRAAATRLSCLRTPDLDIRKSQAIESPVTIFSTIIVPDAFDAWPQSEQDAVLAHEGTHVAHKDFYVQSIAHAHRHLFWFNPLAWWLPHRLSLLSEHISDDAAIETIHERVSYAELLVAFARKSIVGQQAIAMARTATLTARVERILDPESTPSRTSRAKKALIAAMLLPVATIAAAFQMQDAPVQAPLKQEQFSQSPAPREQSATPVSTRRVALPKSNPAHPLSQPVYPPVSRRLLEAGTVVLKLHVLENGRVADAVVEKSSGFVDLDTAAKFESFRWQLDPGTVDGEPQPMWGKFAVTFKLAKDSSAAE